MSRRAGSADIRVGLARSLAIASGAQGMVLGQALDIAAETATSPLTLDEITRLQQGKTGALIAWSAMAGARMAGADIAPLAPMHSAGACVSDCRRHSGCGGRCGQRGQGVGKDAGAARPRLCRFWGLMGPNDRAESWCKPLVMRWSVYGQEARPCARRRVSLLRARSLKDAHDRQTQDPASGHG